MVLNFVWPSTPLYSGGVVALYEFANALARRGHEVHFIHGPAWLNRIDRVDQLDWFDFDPAVRHHIVDTYDDPSLPEGDVVFSPWAPPRLGLPVVFIQGHRMMEAELERSAFRARCPKICIASWLVDVGITEYGVPAEQMVHVPLGIDHQVFRTSAPLERRPVDVAVLYHEHPSKGWGVGVDALSAVRKRRPDLRVDVFGVLAPERTIPRWMRFHLNLERAELARGLAAASIFLQPSWHEGFGFTAVEAMASGSALVSTDNGGSKDYARHGETALVVPPGEPGPMADAIDALLSDEPRRIALATEGERHVRRFDWDMGAARIEEIVASYVADPARYQRAPAVRAEPDIAFAFTPGVLMPRPLDDADADASITRTSPSADRDLVWNVVWTGEVFNELQHFVTSLLTQSGCRFRFVVNGCAPGQVDMMEHYRARHAERVVEVLEVSADDMIAHGVALDRVLDQRDDGPWFSFVDPDIKANAPFASDLGSLLADHDVVTSGKEVWSDDNLVPVDHQGVAGEFFFDRDGFVFGSPHLAIYRRTALDATTARWGIGLGSAGPELSEDAKAMLRKMGHDYLVYDTAKITNALMQADGYQVTHRDLPQLVHIGGLAHFLSPGEYRVDESGQEVPHWTRWASMDARHQVTRYAARMLQAVLAGATPPPVPTELDPGMETRLLLVRDEIIDLGARYGPPAGA